MTNTGYKDIKPLVDLVLEEISSLSEEECERLLRAIDNGELFIRNT